MWAFANPVQVTFGAGCFEEVGRLVAGRPHALVIYGEPFVRSLALRLAATAGRPVLTIDDVAANPDMAALARQSARFGGLATRPELIVALGGGSVIDSAKVFAAAPGDFETVRRVLVQGTGGEALSPLPILAIPTTSGTGSEVTCWGTVWEGAAGRKWSLAHPGLYPRHAVIDPELMLSKPRGLTVQTGLDALSHAFESLWNHAANPVSMACAVTAARAILDTLPRLARDLGDLGLRARMAQAALVAGLAFSNTRTAIAHSLSYPITLRHGVAHGIACSFTLPLIVRSVAEIGGLCRDGLVAILGEDLREGAARLADFLEGLGVSTDPADHGVGPQEWRALIDSALEGERGRNFIGSREALLAAG